MATIKYPAEFYTFKAAVSNIRIVFDPASTLEQQRAQAPSLARDIIRRGHEEEALREVRRRTRPMGVFTNAQSAERIMDGVSREPDADWNGHHPRQIQQNA